MARNRASRPQRWLRWASGLVLIVTGCAEPPGSAQIVAAAPPVPAGQARIWFYRPLEPSESLNLAQIDMNGSYVGAVANGSAFYRDVPPGHYRIAPESFAKDFNQDRSVDVIPGQQLYVKIVSLVAWGSDDNASKNIQRDAFYAWLIRPEAAQAEMARDRSSI
jgi:Protein of unknown function (DUF2846)